MKAATLFAVIACAASLGDRALGGETYSESFTGGSNVGAWTWGNAADTVHPSGGNPGAWLGNNNLDTFAPQPRTGAGVVSVFTGNYRARRVISLGIDLITPSTQFPFSRQLTLMLGNDGGTPFDGSDDCFVYFIGPDLVPQPGEGWRSFEFAVEAHSTFLPVGWQTLGACATPHAAWNAVITDVTDVRYFYGDPTSFFIFQVWDVGLDNPRILEEVGDIYCYSPKLPCPCANLGGQDQGCMNSTGLGASLDATGSSSIAADSVCFTTTHLPPNTTTVLLQGTSGGWFGTFGDGFLCVGFNVRRMGVRFADGDGTTVHGPGLAAQGLWVPGTRRYFQTYYRNLNGPCGTGFNLSSAVGVLFTP